MVGHGKDCLGEAGMARRVVDTTRKAGFGNAGEAWHGTMGTGEDWIGRQGGLSC